MDPTSTLQAVRAWPVDDQVTFVFDLWDELLDRGWQPELTADLKAELDRRLAASEADPTNVRTWDQILERVRRPR